MPHNSLNQNTKNVKYLKIFIVNIFVIFILLWTTQPTYAGFFDSLKKWSGTITIGLTGDPVAASTAHNTVNYFYPGQQTRSQDAFLSGAYLDPLGYHGSNFLSGNSGEKVTWTGATNYGERLSIGTGQGAMFGSSVGGPWGAAGGAVFGNFLSTLPPGQAKALGDNPIANPVKILEYFDVDTNDWPKEIANPFQVFNKQTQSLDSLRKECGVSGGTGIPIPTGKDGTYFATDTTSTDSINSYNKQYETYKAPLSSTGNTESSIQALKEEKLRKENTDK